MNLFEYSYFINFYVFFIMDKDYSKIEMTKKWPDPVICRVKYADYPMLYYCKAVQPSNCGYVGYMDHIAYCLHPDRTLIAEVDK